MSKVPRTPDEYRRWWEANTAIPYGYCHCGCGQTTSPTKQTRRDRDQVAGVPVRFLPAHQNQSKFSTEQKDEACRRYQAGESCYAIARDIGVSGETVRWWLRGRGMARRSTRDAVKRHSLNEAAFAELTPESAYWIGFLFADGHLQPPQVGASPRVTLLLGIRDKGHVEKFREFVGSSHAITVRGPASNRTLNGRVVRSKGSAAIALSSEQLVADLQRHGMRFDGLTSRASSALAERRDFWRGAVDGDGWLRWQPAQGTWSARPQLSLCGGHSLIEQFFVYAKSITTTRASIRPQGKIYTVNVGGLPAARLIEDLYRDAPVALDRKQAIANRVLQETV